MTEQLAGEIIASILNYRREGVLDDDELFEKLQSDYAQQEIDFEIFLELMNTGAFRAGFIMTHGKYPPNNLDNHPVIKTAFKMYWVEQRGEADYNARFVQPKRKWWQRK